MACRRKFQIEEISTPFCQATGCFEKSAYYVVLKETEEPNYYELKQGNNDIRNMTYAARSNEAHMQSDLHFDGFKIIMYFCKRHENDFKYLIRGSELRISKACRLRAPQIIK
jgi:hypothetical protein